MARKVKPKVRMDDNRLRLKKGEYQRKNGTYEYRWSTEDGERRNVYAPTLDKLREIEEQVIVDHYDGIRSDIKSLTVNYMFDLWCQLKKGIKDSTFKNYIYMYETFVRATFGRKRLVDVKKSDVKRFYNRLVDDRGLKISTVDNVHNVLYQVFQIAVEDNMIRSNPTHNTMKELRLTHNLDTEKRKALSVSRRYYCLIFLSGVRSISTGIRYSTSC